MGDLPRARSFALQASAMSGALQRTRALNLTLLASTYAKSDPDQACSLAGQVLTLTIGIRSGRVASYLGNLRQQLVSEHPDDSRVKEFAEVSRDYLGGH
jgi:hypothetical protein